MAIETSIVQALGGILCAAATTGIGVITPKIKKFFEAHTTAREATTASDVIDNITRITESVVSDFNQRLVNDAKSKGAFTEEMAVQFKNDAIDAIKEQASSFIALSGKSENEIQSLISTLLEQAVSKAKGK